MDSDKKLSDPFIYTTLYTTIELRPDQLNNNLRSNLKYNLIKQLENRCYLNYGYICKIYEILEMDNGTIIPEDLDACARFKIKFSCRLCHPLENTVIIGKIDQLNDVHINILRDPIHIISTPDTDRMNMDVFMKDQDEKKIRIRKTGEELLKGTYVKVVILAKSFVHRDKKILALGRLENIATDEEVSQFYSEMYNPEKKQQDFEEYKSSNETQEQNKNTSDKKIQETKK